MREQEEEKDTSICGKTFSSPRHGVLDQALIYSLCEPPTGAAAALPYLRTTTTTTSFFGALNSFVQQIFDHLTAGEGVPQGNLHKHVYLGKLGGELPVEHYFKPKFMCPPADSPCWQEQRSRGRSPEWALSQLRGASRYLLISHLSHLLFQPRHKEKADHATMHFDVAIHLDGTSNAHAPDAIVRHVSKLLECVRVAAPYNRTMKYANHSTPPRLLLAADDDTAASAVADQLRTQFPRATIERAPLSAPNAAGVSSGACDINCIAPSFDVIAATGRAQALVLSLSSDLGRYLLSMWASKNDNNLPVFVDLDAKATRANLLDAKFFCRLDDRKGSELCGASGSAAPSASSWTRSALDDAWSESLSLGGRQLASTPSKSVEASRTRATNTATKESTSKSKLKRAVPGCASGGCKASVDKPASGPSGSGKTMSSSKGVLMQQCDLLTA